MSVINDIDVQALKDTEELIALVESRSPIRDTLISPVDVLTTLA
ncbi:hypothetical protein ACIGW1_04870 [Streptomyces sp. NPDC053780]